MGLPWWHHQQGRKKVSSIDTFKLSHAASKLGANKKLDLYCTTGDIQTDCDTAPCIYDTDHKAI
jgi:hypothetical protein